MSLATNLASLATRLATECKTLRSLLNGNASNLSALTTTAKSNLVAAINELQGEIDALAAEAAGIDDDVASSASTYSSSKVVELLDELKDELLGSGAAAALDTIGELAAALGNDVNAITTITTALGRRVRFDAAQTLTSGEKMQALANIGAAASSDVGDTATDFVATFNAGLV